MTDSTWGDIYKELGAKPIINAIGSVTMLGGSTPLPEVKEAMEAADVAYIPLMELEEKAGQWLADIIDVPAAYVTSGAGSALTLATAAIMAGDDDDKIQQLPDTTGMKNEILIQRRHRYWYDRCLELAGAKLVDFGSEEETTREDLENAIGPNTAAVHYYAVEQSPDPKALSLEDTIEIAHAKGVLVTVDAAGQIYPLENFGKYVRMGADFQCIAAKYMGAPQSTGLALGTEDMIRKLSYQSFVGYEGRRIRGVGRPQKIDRQEMMGTIAATRRWFTMNHEERLAQVEQQCQTVMAPLVGIPGLDVELLDNIIGHQPFGVQIGVDPDVTGMTAQDVVDELKAGDPPVWTRVREGESDIVIHGFGMSEGQDKIVGERIAALFGR
ncbi:MAG: aminotransferase class V-fold PLP-dependent enzyme [SAR202 cluster bacterium]|nr:aminotransferase class V-fold PLP-dependent enzyme [SAR202 cluster bacterium]